MRTLVLSLCALFVFSGTFLSGSAVAQGAPSIAGCPIFPADNIWNTPVDTLPPDPNSDSYINSIGRNAGVHPDFGSGMWEGAPIGIPFVTVPGTQPMAPVACYYADESDAGPYPIPLDAPIEGGSDSNGDRHVLVLDRDRCMLYEIYDAWPQQSGSWSCGSGAIYNLYSYTLRPEGWTSADAAGLPMLPGLARYDEVAAGEITHALRFTAPSTRRAYIWPARHYASSSTNPALPPMGQRFRLKAGVDISGFSPQVQVILRALKKYGMILADNGSSWYISGVPDSGWNDDALVGELRQVHGDDFEAVDVSSLMLDPNSGQVRTDGSDLKRLSVGTAGNGSVTSVPGGVGCPGDCLEDFPTGTTVEVTATAGAGYVLDRWMGDCVGSAPTCSLIMSADRQATAVFSPAPQWVTVQEPNGGERWKVGRKMTIRWRSGGFSGKVRIELSTDGGLSWRTIIAGTPNDGAQQWKVPRLRTTQGRLRITAVSDSSIIDASDANFTIF
ncbi:Putative outermembrane protein (modular protein) [Candidatus Methylomirabilis oxygeniifera]|uniref:Putative outermembrane protein (Modular protein) n=1 Tax=Methylomirabilis oxygeniifera TaxID=671143 RepID=D5MIB8_METO1|nr:Putative outermembrane protein (modular protein) [Candidatus Methylomirabilis oxyfera]